MLLFSEVTEMRTLPTILDKNFPVVRTYSSTKATTSKSYSNCRYLCCIV